MRYSLPAILGQRIFQQPFAWKALGVEVRGRSSTLKINYRTSHQIRSISDRLLDSKISDVDGNADRRDSTISIFNGPVPEIQTFLTAAEEIAAVSSWLRVQSLNGIAPHEIAIIVRSDNEITRARDVAEQAGLKFKVLNESVETTGGYASICTMPLAKGLEFRTVAVMACEDEIVSSSRAHNIVGDEADLEEVYVSEASFTLRRLHSSARPSSGHGHPTCFRVS